MATRLLVGPMESGSETWATVGQRVMPAESTPSRRGYDGNEDHSCRPACGVFALVGAVSACGPPLHHGWRSSPTSEPGATSRPAPGHPEDGVEFGAVDRSTESGDGRRYVLRQRYTDAAVEGGQSDLDSFAVDGWNRDDRGRCDNTDTGDATVARRASDARSKAVAPPPRRPCSNVLNSDAPAG